VNDDGYNDLLFSAASYDNNVGKTYLIFGKQTGWSNGVISSRANVSFIGEYDGDESGFSVAWAGDVNDDGFDDFLIGARRNNESSYHAGQTYLFFGKITNTWLLGVSCTEADASFIGEDAEDLSGISVAGEGDVNRDSFDDILIGASLNDEGGENAGKVYLIGVPVSNPPFLLPFLLSPEKE